MTHLEVRMGSPYLRYVERLKIFLKSFDINLKSYETKSMNPDQIPRHQQLLYF